MTDLVFLSKKGTHYHLPTCEKRNGKMKEVSIEEAQGQGAVQASCCQNLTQPKTEGEKDMADNEYEIPQFLRADPSDEELLPGFSAGTEAKTQLVDGKPDEFEKFSDGDDDEDDEPQIPETFKLVPSTDDEEEGVEEADDDDAEPLVLDGLDLDDTDDQEELDLEGREIPEDGGEIMSATLEAATQDLPKISTSSDSSEETQGEEIIVPEDEGSVDESQVIDPAPDSKGESSKGSESKEKKSKKIKGFLIYLWKNIISVILFVSFWKKIWKLLSDWKEAHPKIVHGALSSFILWTGNRWKWAKGLNWGRLKRWSLLPKKEKAKGESTSTKKTRGAGMRILWGKFRAKKFLAGEKVKNFSVSVVGGILWVGGKVLRFLGKFVRNGSPKVTLMLWFGIFCTTVYLCHPEKVQLQTKNLQTWTLETKQEMAASYETWSQKRAEKKAQAEKYAEQQDLSGPVPAVNQIHKAEIPLMEGKSKIKFSIERIEVSSKGTKLHMRIQNSGEKQHSVSIDIVNSSIMDRTGTDFLKGASQKFKYFCGNNRVGLKAGEMVQGYLRFVKPADFRREVLIQILDLNGGKYSLNINNLLKQEEE